MRIAAQNHTSYTRSNRRSNSPDEVSPEFPQRRTTPGPDDVYDPDRCGRGSEGGSARYWDVDTSSESGGSLVLF
ncbi:MAG: hypothetical protein U0931_12105 [Vulcanimicrobiota bacterium]